MRANPRTSLVYPPTAAGPDADDYHGELVADPYRWLEDTQSPQTAAWIAAQNELTHGWLADCADRPAFTELLTRLHDYPKHGVPFERGGRWFQFRNTGLQDQPVLFVMESPDSAGRVLLDPNEMSADGTVAVTGFAVSEDGELLGYSVSAHGSDWQTWHVREVPTGTDRADRVEWSKFSGLAWRHDGSGFYYGAPDKPAGGWAAGAEYLAEIGVHRIYFHRLGTPQGADEQVFAVPEQPTWMPFAEVTDDGRFLVVVVRAGTAPQSRIHVLDLTAPSATMTELIGDFDSIANVVTTLGTTFYLVTDYRAERKRLVAVDLDQPGRGHWREIVPEADDTLLGAWYFGGHFVCHYLRDACSVLRVYRADGGYVRELELPGFPAIADGCRMGPGITGRPGSPLVHIGLTSFLEPGSVWSHRLDTGQTTRLGSAHPAISPGGYVTERVRVTSADGTAVPLFVIRRADVTPQGDVPVLLYGYGGFDIPVTPWFSALHAAWVELGGLLAVANLRGGGEFGRPWHEAGRLALKQNVFDDFCACARWMASVGWSRPDRIAISGSSNGGLLVGACLTQHPELFGACVADVGVHDMLRFHKFTIGRAWISDYGDPDDPEQFRWLRAYSPLHNVRPGAHYPATLLLTGDHDDRVVPGHSFKFAATLQAAQAARAPVLIRVDTSTGHGAGTPISKIIAESADVLAFLHWALGASAPAA
jgi:prolyl oligopeptidase